VTIIEFAATAGLLVLVPGAGTMVVIRNTLRGGPRGGIATAGGMALGIFVWAMLVAAGAAALLARWPEALTVVRWLGAGYIAWLGLEMLRTAWAGALPHAAQAGAAAGNAARSVREGLVTNLLNPPLPLFYVAMLPHVLGPDDAPIRTALVLASVHGAEALAWLSVVSLAVGRAQQLLMKDRVRRGIEAVAGVALLLLAARLVLLAPH
jgi:threonine/homoserine/homoserine lactone efflux protein